MAILKVIENATLQERVYHEIRTAILDGRFQPGETLTIRGLSEALGTSTMPVREAVQRLSAERALDVLPGRSVRLPELSLEIFRDVWAVRLMVEGRAARDAALNAEARDIKKIEKANARLITAIKAGQGQRMVADNRDFHFAVYDAAKNPVLSGIIESLWLQSSPYVALLYAANPVDDAHITESTVDCHGRLIQAIKAKDAKTAEAALRSDIEASQKMYERLVTAASSEKREKKQKA